jgi:hypothetical protein
MEDDYYFDLEDDFEDERRLADEDYFDDRGWAGVEVTLGTEIQELLPAGRSADDRRLLYDSAIRGVSTEMDLPRSLSVMIIAGREVLNENGIAAAKFHIEYGQEVLRLLDEHFPFAVGHDRARLYEAGRRNQPYAANDDELVKAMAREWQKGIRGSWRQVVNSAEFRGRCDVFERASRRPVRSARRVRSVRTSRTVRSGCSPGPSSGGDDPPPPRPYVVDLRLAGVPA